LIEDDEEELSHHTMGASNNWAIHGNHTKNGKPIIANDPHLGNQMPSNWHVSHMKITENGRIVSEQWGSYFCGVPLPAIGGNTYITFTLTVLPVDSSDLYEEKLEGENYLFKDQWLPMKFKREVIKVKGQEPEIITVR
jgi:penicillin G amidase